MLIWDRNIWSFGFFDFLSLVGLIDRVGLYDRVGFFDLEVLCLFRQRREDNILGFDFVGLGSELVLNLLDRYLARLHGDDDVALLGLQLIASLPEEDNIRDFKLLFWDDLGFHEYFA